MARRSNCFIFALAAWWRWRKQGAYWALRNTRHLAGWHWLVHYRGRWIAFEPLEYYGTWWREVVAKLYYSGAVRWGDKHRSKTMNNATVTINFTISTKAQPHAHSTVLTYNGMDDAQIAQFELDLLEAFSTMQQKWMAKQK